MGSHDRIVCSKCHGENDRGSRFCWYCGAPLRGSGNSGAQAIALDVAAHIARWLIFLAALAGVVYGVYYALDRYVWPAVDSETAVNPTVTTTTLRLTTTTTLLARVDRVVPAGADRYATAIAISETAFPDGAPALVLVPGDDFSQGLAVAPLAAAYGGPVLLMPPDGLRNDLAAELQRLAPSQVFLVAIPGARSLETAISALLTDATVTRLTGGDAFQTAAVVAEELKRKTGTVTKVVVAPSDSFLEGLVIAPLAAANGWPILLAPSGGDVPRATAQAIKALEVDSALVVGLDVEVELDDVETQVGTDSFDTAALIVRYASTHGCTFTHTAVVTGANFPDAMVAASSLAADRGILIPALDGRPPSALLALLHANLADVRMLDIIALPEFAKEMATKGATASQSSGTATTGTSTTSTTGKPTTTTERDTPKPSAGGF